MPKFKKGDGVRFTFSAMEYPDLVPSTDYIDTGLKIFGRGEIVGEPGRAGCYPVKVTEPVDWRGGNDLGGFLHGTDRGKGCFFREDAMMFEEAVDKNLNSSQEDICQECGTKMKHLFTSKYCPKCG